MNNLPIVSESIHPISQQDLDSFNPQSVTDKSFAIIFDNFLRDKIMFNLILSIQKYYPSVKMYIAEQGVYHPLKMKLYEKLTKAGHEIIYVGFDAGLSVSRNTLVKAVKEPYIFYCDCDNLFTEHTKLEVLKDILVKNPKIGFVGIQEYFGQAIKHYEHYLGIKNRRVTYYPVKQKEYTKDFFVCDLVMNVGLARKELFDSALWDGRMKLAEHVDFFLNIKYNTNWKIGCSTKVTISNQNFVSDNPIYKAYRGRNKVFWRLYKEKWQVDNVDGWQIEFDTPTVSKPIPPKSIKVEEKSKTSILKDQQIIDSLMNSSVKWWFLKNSCLSVLNQGKIKLEETLRLGVTNEVDKQTIGKLLDKFGIKYDIYIEPRRNCKFYSAYGYHIQVPIPVVTYLKDMYGEKWESLK